MCRFQATEAIKQSFQLSHVRGVTRIWKEGRQKNLRPWGVIIFGEKLPP
jgi:hypothetical protein